jgi:hypothetical protein
VSTDRAATRRAFEDAILKFGSALTKIEAALTQPASGEEAAHLSALEELAKDSSAFFKRRQAFNMAIVNELKHQRAIQRAVVELIHCQTSLIEFLQTIKPYVDTRDFSDVLRAIGDEGLKRSDALLARDRRRELQLTDVEAELTAIRARLDELQRTIVSSARGGASPA